MCNTSEVNGAPLNADVWSKIWASFFSVKTCKVFYQLVSFTLSLCILLRAITANVQEICIDLNKQEFTEDPITLTTLIASHSISFEFAATLTIP